MFLASNLFSDADYSDENCFEDNRSLQEFIMKVQLENNLQIIKITNQMKKDNLTPKDILYSLYELNRIQYQNQILKLSNDVADVDTHNNILETKINSIEKRYEFQLESLNKQMQITLKSQQKTYETELQSQWNMFYWILGIIIFIGIFFGVVFKYKGIPEIEKLIKDEIVQLINESHKNLVSESVDKSLKELSINKSFLDLIIESVKNSDNLPKALDDVNQLQESKSKNKGMN